MLVKNYVINKCVKKKCFRSLIFINLILFLGCLNTSGFSPNFVNVCGFSEHLMVEFCILLTFFSILVLPFWRLDLGIPLNWINCWTKFPEKWTRTLFFSNPEWIYERAPSRACGVTYTCHVHVTSRACDVTCMWFNVHVASRACFTECEQLASFQ